jgi:hypothetical protein
MEMLTTFQVLFKFQSQNYSVLSAQTDVAMSEEAKGDNLE